MSLDDISAVEVSFEEANINKQTTLQDHIPLHEPTFFILLSLATRPRHGYAIMKDVLFLSRERVKLSTSTLYTALKRLLEQGWIVREDDPVADENGRERKVYRLTEQGQRVLEVEVKRLDSLVRAAQQWTAGGQL